MLEEENNMCEYVGLTPNTEYLKSEQSLWGGKLNPSNENRLNINQRAAFHLSQSTAQRVGISKRSTQVTWDSALSSLLPLFLERPRQSFEIDVLWRLSE